MTVEPFPDDFPGPDASGPWEPAGFDAWVLAPRGPAVHTRILEMARELPAVANKGDHPRLSREASALLEVFVRHAEDERPVVLRLPPFTARLVQHGQQRVVDRLVSLVLEADIAEEPCRCAELADEVASLIEVQIVSEEWDQTDR
ncbi:MAG TPA: hypothetical protein VE991_06805 [Acidimicrobiales bacterium]|nr:hypothetical protein [Acidimicrobiales bacterium]